MKPPDWWCGGLRGGKGGVRGDSQEQSGGRWTGWTGKTQEKEGRSRRCRLKTYDGDGMRTRGESEAGRSCHHSSFIIHLLIRVIRMPGSDDYYHHDIHGSGADGVVALIRAWNNWLQVVNANFIRSRIIIIIHHRSAPETCRLGHLSVFCVLVA